MARAEAREQVADLESELKGVKEEATAHAERHVTMLKALQQTLRVLVRDASDVAEEEAGHHRSVQKLQERIGGVMTEQERPLREWYDDMKRTFLYAMQQMTQAKQESENARDEVWTCALAVYVVPGSSTGGSRGGLG